MESAHIFSVALGQWGNLEASLVTMLSSMSADTLEKVEL
jgi:hypothetical protein